jgi:hypothetical protein
MNATVLPEGATIITVDEGGEFMSMIAEHYADEFADDDDLSTELVDGEHTVNSGGVVCIIVKGVPQ